MPFFFQKCDVIDLPTEQMYGRVEIHDVTQHSVMPATFSVQSTHWLLLGCYGNSVSCESSGMLLPHTTRTKQPCGVEVGSGVAELPVANFVINPRLKWYFHNRTDRGGVFLPSSPPSEIRNYWSDLQNSNGI